jgi:hypothetical protein
MPIWPPKFLVIPRPPEKDQSIFLKHLLFVGQHLAVNAEMTVCPSREYLPNIKVIPDFIEATCEGDARFWVESGIPSYSVHIPSSFRDRDEEKPLVVAFDFDATLASGASESNYQNLKSQFKNGLILEDDILRKYTEHEIKNALNDIGCGPMLSVLKALIWINSSLKGLGKAPAFLIHIVTARGHNENERVFQHLERWGVSECFEPHCERIHFMGGKPKSTKLIEIGADGLFDDSRRHIDDAVLNAKIEAFKVPPLAAEFEMRKNC